MATPEKAKDGKISRFFRDVRSELKKVSWPNRKELTKSTFVVLATVVVASLAMVLIDSVFSNIIKLFIK